MTLPHREPDARAVEAAILDLLSRRADDATVCPSEVARALAPDGQGWQPLMPLVRQVAQRLVQDGRLQVTRRGVPVDDATGRGGPVRLGRPRPPQED
ncbi:DUF3253 domain-containing protein [Aquabacterium sp. J223]|uniref:DUF3253 domain-containing protein n=1 Tax=Aquabacterium sp. J223 TaxID=2898431 RepID=UPI0021ADD094|nr:DUF3253 domain-containing protein [Aquabacterium sp. J223]UUX96165.1 DUF3253 domain-containing protein [Aquabacterium sp. J223]